MVDKKVTMELIGLDGNAFSILGAFRREARRQGWTQEEIDEVMNEAKSGDYNQLLSTMIKYTESEDDSDDWGDWNDRDWDDDDDDDWDEDEEDE